MAETGLLAREPVAVRSGLGQNKGEPQVLEDRAKGCAGFVMPHERQAEPADELIALTDGDCIPVMQALTALGSEPGRDIDVAGYDDYWRRAGERRWCPYRPCATVAKDNFGIGRRLADTLLERLGGAIESPSVRLLHAPRIVPTI